MDTVYNKTQEREKTHPPRRIGTRTCRQQEDNFSYNMTTTTATALRQLPVMFACCCLTITLAALLPTVVGELDDGTGGLVSRHFEEMLVQPNSMARIGCKLSQTTALRPSFYYWNFLPSTATGGAKPTILCFADKCPDENYFGFKLDQNLETGAYDLLINNVTYELNDGLYFCECKDTTTETKQYRLTVLIPPQPPIVVPATPTPAREGQEYQLNCISHGGNPEPNISWYRNEQQLAATPNLRIEQSRTNGTTVSTLSWTPTLEDHQASYKCAVWNKAMSPMQSLERELRLQVEYAPRINVGPFNPLKVLLGSSVTLSCQVDANPPIKGIRWYKDGHLISNQFNHTIPETRLSDSSVYSCQADNGILPNLGHLHGQVINPASSFLSLIGLAQNDHSKSPTAVESQLQLQLLYPPRVQVKSSKANALSEGDQFALNCSVDSFPPPIEFIWTKQDDPNFRRIFSGQNSFLEFPSISASDMGNYTCTASNRMEPSGYHQHLIEKHSSGSLLVQVRHKPGIGEISLGQAGETELGAKTQIQCRARPPGYPEPSYKFWKFQGNGQSKLHLNKQAIGPIYTIHSAKPDDEAKYGCIAQNDMGFSTEAEGELIVNEPPSIVPDPASREDARPQGDYPYSFIVRATGKPEPKVTWFHRSPVDGRRVELSSSEMRNRFAIETITKTEQNQMRPKFTVFSTLNFKTPLEVDDRGQYTVEFNNGLSRTATETFQLHINHQPIPAPKYLPIIAGTTRASRTRAAHEPGETVNLTCRVSAYPKPLFEWYNSQSDKPIETNSRYRTLPITNPKDDIWESTLTFSQAQESDYGEYMCVTANQDARLGESVQIMVNLSRKSPPEAPSNLEAIEATQDSITLQWTPGFDGGFAQNQFLVQYAIDDGSGQSLAKRFPSTDLASIYQHQQEAIEQPKVHECPLTGSTCTIGQLLPRQAYIFRLLARNELGSSEFSDELRAMTRSNLSQIPLIKEGSYDPKDSILYFRIESGSDYLLNNLKARVEYTFGPYIPDNQNQLLEPIQEISAQQALTDWKVHNIYSVKQEKTEIHLKGIPANVDQLRVTLCSKSNDSLCGSEFLVGTRKAAMFFLHDQRGFSLSILVSTLVLIMVLGGLATSVHSCCLSRKAKKADTIERIDDNIDNKPISNGTSNNLSGNKASQGSTTSTNSTSMNATNGLQSMESISGGLSGAGTSDHSSDHSRQAKLDSMLPPNYNHYADRASIMLEQQQQQQYLQHQALMSDKLGSPFGLPNSALLGAGGQQMPSPMMNNHFTYDQAQIDPQQTMMDNGIMMSSMLDPDGQQQAMWPNQLDDYNYNALAFGGQAHASQDHMIDPTYGTAASVMMSQQAAAYDNSANSSQFQSYLNAYPQSQDPEQQYQQQRAQYQQEIAVAQQQMYGTLTRNGYSAVNGTASASTPTTNDINKSAQSNNSASQQLMEQQYSTTNGLVQPPQLPPPVESDYGTIGGRSGRLIREIIV